MRAHYVTAREMVPLMRGRESPLIIEVSAGDEGKGLGDVQYDVAKAAMDRLGFALSRSLTADGIVSVVVYPGFTRTERVIREAPAEAFPGTDSSRFVGRAVVALASDVDVVQRNGGVFKVCQLGLDYGLTDIDGSRPKPFVIPNQ